jgi:hypothetical protein
MPRLTPENKKKSIEKLITKIKADGEVAKRDLNALLADDLIEELEVVKKHQQSLKKIKKPIALNEYEKLHKQALMLFGRYDNYVVKAKVISNILVDRKAKKDELANKTKVAIKKAQDYLFKLLEDDKDLLNWFDRDIKLIGKDIGLQYDLLPFVITSRSKDKLVDIKERFGLKSIKEMRLDILNKALALVDKEIDDWYEKNGYVREEKLTEEEQKLREEKLKGLLANLRNRR